MSSIFRKLAIVCCALLALTACADDNGSETEGQTDPVIPTPAPHQNPAPAPRPPIDTRYDDVVELVFQNRLSRPVYKLYVAPTESDSWGPDLLGRRVLPSGASITFESERCDAYYDVMAVDANGARLARKNGIYMRCGAIVTVTLKP